MGRYGGAFGRRAGEPLDRGAPGGRARRARGRVRPLRPAARLQGRLGRGGRLPRGEAHGTRFRFLRGAPAARRARRRGRRRLDRGRPVRAGRLLRRRRRRAVVPRGRHHAPLRRAQIAGSADPRLGGAEGSRQGVPGPAVGRGRRRAHRVGAHGLQGGLRAARGEARPAQRQAQRHCDAGRRLRAAAVVVGGSRRRGVGAGRPVRSAHRPPGAEAAHGGRRRRGARHVPQRGRPRRHGLHGVRIRARARGHPRRPLRPRVLRPGPVGLGDGGGVPFGQRPGQARRGEALPGGRGHGGERQGARVGPAARRPGRGDLPRAGGDVGTGGGVRAVRLRGVPAAQEPQGGGLPRPDLGRVLARAVPVAHIEQGQGVRRQGRPGVRHPRAQRPRPHGGVP